MVKATRVLVVLDPGRMDQPALEKGESVARMDDASLHLYCCIDQPADEAHRRVLLEQVRRWVDRLAISSRSRGIYTSTEVEWREDWRSGVVRAATRYQADLVVKSTRPRIGLRRALLKHADWALLRDCPCAMLLVKTARPWVSGKVLAGVKIEANDQTHTVLNDWVVRIAHHIADDIGGELHIVTAYRGEGIWFDRQALADRCEVPRNRIHGAEGPADRIITQVAEQLAADILVIGTVAQREAETLVGHTAERLVEEVDADIVALPPRVRRHRITEELAEVAQG